MNFEDELRATMRGHDTEAPRVADLPPQPWQRRRPPTWLLAAAAAVVVAAIAVPVAALSGSGAGRPSAASSSHGHVAPPVVAALTCPSRDPTLSHGSAATPWVPAPPHGVPSAADRLVPQTPPSTAVVCAYLHQDPGKLTGSRTVATGLARIPAQLSMLPKQLPHHGNVCALPGQVTDDDSFLIGLRYGSGLLWIGTFGNCAGASNGRFTTLTNLRTEADTAYRAGTWPPPTTAPCASSAGRLGDERALVPGTPDRLTICDGAKLVARTSDIAGIVAALDRLPLSPTPTSASSCIPTPGISVQSYELRFGYSSGPDAIVIVWQGCVPGVSNANLQSRNATTVLREIDALLAHR